VIARVAASHLGIGRGLALDVGTRQVVEQQLELGSEELAVAGRQMTLQRGLVGQQPIETPVEPVGVDLRRVDAEEVIQRGAAEPAGLDAQLAARRTESIDRQDRRGAGPGDVGWRRVQNRRAERVQPQALPQVPPEPDIPEVSRPRLSDPIQTDLDDRRVGGDRGGARGEERQLLFFPLRVEDPDGLAPPGLDCAVQLAKIADRLLAWSLGRTDGLDERPVDVVFPVLVPMIRSNKHRARPLTATVAHARGRRQERRSTLHRVFRDAATVRLRQAGRFCLRQFLVSCEGDLRVAHAAGEVQFPEPERGAHDAMTRQR